jgi:DNA topoisomerase IA
VVDRTVVWIDSGPVAWVAEGAVLREPGFLVFWGPYARQEDVVLPALRAGQVLTPDDLRVLEKKTTPPPRYDQGGLIKKLESSASAGRRPSRRSSTRCSGATTCASSRRDAGSSSSSPPSSGCRWTG